jgi:hypothetical protein
MIVSAALIIHFSPAFADTIIAHPTPPPAQIVSPQPTHPDDLDSNDNKIGDQLEAQITADAAHSPEKLEDPTDVELWFSEQITQAQIDAFLKMGGTFQYIFPSDEYGWDGTIALNQVTNLPQAMGPSLLVVINTPQAGDSFPIGSPDFAIDTPSPTQGTPVGWPKPVLLAAIVTFAAGLAFLIVPRLLHRRKQ